MKQKVEERSTEYDIYIGKVLKILNQILEDHEIKGEVTGRVKHLWSTFNKMQKQGLPFDQIYDLIAFRILVDSVRDC